MNKILAWFYPFARTVFPNIAGTLTEVGQAMINAAQYRYEKNVLEVKDIRVLAEKSGS